MIAHFLYRVSSRWINLCCGLSLVALVLLFAGPQHAAACTPTMVPVGFVPPTPVPLAHTVANMTQGAQVVVEGAVVQRIEGNNRGSTIVVRVDQYLKGLGPTKLHITGYNITRGCMEPIPAGAHGVFFALGDPTQAQPLQFLDYLSANPTVSQAVTAASMQTPLSPEQPHITELLISVAVVVIIIGAFIVRSLFVQFDDPDKSALR
jgi:hypothetical protein